MTAYRMWKAGILPVPSEQLPTGTIVVLPPTEAEFAIYARVSSGDQRADLDRQVARLSEYAAQNTLVVREVTKEIGSGLNGHRKALLRLLRSQRHILVEHRDRLCRFGFEQLQAALEQAGRSIIVVDDQEVEDDIVRDLHEIIVSLCARLYGKRAAKNRADRALKAIQCE
jgi:predicted site-specific integrase-resolvase